MWRDVVGDINGHLGWVLGGMRRDGGSRHEDTAGEISLIGSEHFPAIAGRGKGQGEER